MKLGAVVLAAGQGKRLKTDLAKVLHLAHGRPLLQWVLEAVTPLAPAKTVVVVGHRKEQVEAFLSGQKVEIVVQDPPAGTGDAVRVALPALAGCELALVLPGDAPLLQSESLSRLVAMFQREKAACALLSAVLDEGGPYGRIVRQDGKVVAIVEARDASPEQLAIREVNAGVYVFDVAKIRPLLVALAPTNSQGEYYLTDVVAALVARGEKVVAMSLKDPEETLGVNTRGELAEVGKKLNARVVRFWQENGVTVLDPETTWIEAGCQIGRDTVLEAGVHLRGQCRLGERCRVGAHSVLEDVQLAPGTQVAPLTYMRGS
ncbi:MAG: NTP transferase domain-containing protein [Thermoanaerobaculum sp.]